MDNFPNQYKEIIIGATVDELRRFKPMGWSSMYGDSESTPVKIRKWYSPYRLRLKAMLWLHKKSSPYADCCGGYDEV
jgi:hypothetical protein